MNTATLIVKKAGFVIPEGYLKKAFKINNSCIGGISRYQGELAVFHGDKGISVEDFMKQQSQIKDMDCVFYVAHFDGDFNSDDVQPFCLQAEGEDNTQVIKAAFFAEGAFPNFHSPEHTEEYNLLHDAVMPMMVDHYELSKGDMDKFHERLSSPAFAKTLEGLTGARGAFTLILPNGDPIVVSANNTLGGAYDWGIVSQHHNYDANEVDQTPIVQKVKNNVLSFLGGGSKADAPAPAPDKPAEPAKPVEEPAKPVTAPAPKEVGGQQSKNAKVVTTAATSTKAGGKMVQIPTNLGGRHLKKWIRQALKLSAKDNLPEGWAQMKEIWVPDVVGGTVKDLKDIGKVVDMKAAAPKTGLEAKAAADAKKQTPAPAKSGVPVDVQQNVMTTAEKKAMREYVDTLSNKTQSPEEIQKGEARFGFFSKQSGINLEETFRWPAEFIHGMSDKGVRLYAIELRRMLINTLAEEQVTAPTAPVEEPVVETPAAEPLKVPASGGFGGLSFLSPARKAG